MQKFWFVINLSQQPGNNANLQGYTFMTKEGAETYAKQKAGAQAGQSISWVILEAIMTTKPVVPDVKLHKL